MAEIRSRHLVRVVVGVVAVFAQLALAFYYVVLSILAVPDPWWRVLWVAWAAEMVAVIWLAIRHTWFAPLVPAVSLVAVLLLFGYGEANLGWGP
jgi:hypothetical protein